MARHAKFEITDTPQGWRVNVPARFNATGKRERFFFQKKQDAKAKQAELKNRVAEYGQSAANIKPGLAEEAVAAAALLAPYGITLLQAARRIADAEEAALASVDIAEAFEAFKEAKASLSAKQVEAIRHMGKHLCDGFTGRSIAGITAEEIAEHVSSTTNGTAAFNGRVRLLVTLWRWAGKSPRQWCDPALLADVERKNHTEGEIGLLTAKEAAALLAAAEEHFPDCVLPFAISLFTGLRQAELERLRPCDITAEGITVPAISSKTKRRRFVEMPAPLADWLAAYPIADDVCPPNWARKEKAVRRLAGFKVWSDLVPTIDDELTADPPADLPAWPSNALRHTAATVAVGLGKPLESLIFEHGHSGGVALLKRHYLGAMPKAEAAAIWAIRPHGKTAPKIAVA